MNEILDFYDDIYTETLNKTMNEYAKEHLTWKKKLKCVQKYYLEKEELK